MPHSRSRPSRNGSKTSGIKHEIDDLVRGVCGGFLFGIPMLYTLEVWQIGSSVSPGRLLSVLLTTLLGTYLLSRTEGFRKTAATREREAFADAVEAIALGLICALLTLIVLRQITPATSFGEALGKVIFESIPFSLGVTLANQLLLESDDSGEQNNRVNGQQQKGKRSPRFFPDDNFNETLADIGATVIGSVIIAFSIAPTDEVTELVAAVDGLWLLLVVLLSVGISYGIVFQANFARQGQRRLQQGLFQQPLSETLFSYLVSLAAAMAMLSLFRKLDPTAPWELAFRQMLILGLPATIGGAAGRLAL